MAGIKREREFGDKKSSKKVKIAKDGTASSKSARPSSASPVEQEYSDTEDVNGVELVQATTDAKPGRSDQAQNKPESYPNPNGGSTSRESHAKQKALAQDRKAAKPNSDSIQRSKKLWEQLRRKSHVKKEERDVLVKELFDIITGRVQDFVFKHDSVRVIQTALKYAAPAQRKQIAVELKGHYRELAESKYAKFLIAKMVIGDTEVRDLVVQDFYGHVKRLMRHPEASWIVDDIYRTIATKEQKAIMLREWYGPEFVLFGKAKSDSESSTSDLSEILKQNPEKRGPIMQHLKEMTNHLVQKKTTGFTILHDAMLQYLLNSKSNSPEQTEFLDMLRDDEEGDCIKNLAFTKSGSRVVCLALAYGNSKDRRTILKFFKTHIKLLAGDLHGHNVLLTAYEVIDDTVMTAKAIFPELLSKDLDDEARDQELMAQTEHLTARVPLLYLMSPEPPKWLLAEASAIILKEVKGIRETTSKKEPATRRAELLKPISQPLLDLVASNASLLAQSSFGCQFITEVLLGAIGDKEAALASVARLGSDQSEETEKALSTPAVGRMLKALVQGGRFDHATKTIQKTDPPLKFHQLLYDDINTRGDDEIVKWANGPNSFVVVAMLEAEDFEKKDNLLQTLKARKAQLSGENAGARIILEKIVGKPVEGGDQSVKKEKKRKSDTGIKAEGVTEEKSLKVKKEKKA
jgi:pumilio family protein 6